MVDDEFRISAEERERLVAEEVEEFPINTPKYTTYLLNPAINLSQSNRPEVVGQMSEIIDDFRTKHPDGTFEDWIEFYFEKYDGERRLKEATERAVPMVKKMKEAFDQVDKDMTHNYLRDLVLFKTYEGFDIQETILRKLRDMYDAEIERATPDREEIDAPIVYYDENKTNKAMTVDISELKSAMK
ncbi:MjaI family restriction endonuclease [Halobacteriales archaeon QS_9_70_65]|nr:MAG: MjaI family restriction endonuclease [Halobacteriales archaeon QS_9_70_65]